LSYRDDQFDRRCSWSGEPWHGFSPLTALEFFSIHAPGRTRRKIDSSAANSLTAPRRNALAAKIKKLERRCT
jgi:hypothetical protein